MLSAASQQDKVPLKGMSPESDDEVLPPSPTDDVSSSSPDDVGYEDNLMRIPPSDSIDLLYLRSKSELDEDEELDSLPADLSPIFPVTEEVSLSVSEYEPPLFKPLQPDNLRDSVCIADDDTDAMGDLRLTDSDKPFEDGHPQSLLMPSPTSLLTPVVAPTSEPATSPVSPPGSSSTHVDPLHNPDAFVKRVKFNENPVSESIGIKPFWRPTGVRLSGIEVLMIYNQACFSRKINPMKKVVQLLETLDTTPWTATLDVSGERITADHLDALEVVLREIRFSVLEFSDTGLETETAISLFDLVRCYDSCETLNISRNGALSALAWQDFSKMLRHSDRLSILYCNQINLNETFIKALCMALSKGCSLAEVHLDRTVLGGDLFMKLVSLLLLNKSLAHLSVAESRLAPVDAVQLSRLLNPKQPIAVPLQVLNLEGNNLLDVGIMHVVDAVCATINCGGRGLRELNIGNNQLTISCILWINKLLVTSKYLEVLELHDNSLCDDGVDSLQAGLLQSSLRRLNLRKTRLFCFAAISLTEFLVESKTIESLDLRENEIRTAGLFALKNGVKTNRGITTLLLDQTTKKENGVQNYAEEQTNALNDIRDYLEVNEVQRYCRSKGEDTPPEKRALRVELPQHFTIDRPESQSPRNGPPRKYLVTKLTPTHSPEISPSFTGSFPSEVEEISHGVVADALQKAFQHISGASSSDSISNGPSSNLRDEGLLSGEVGDFFS